MCYNQIAMIYLDGAATSKLLPSVKTAMLAAMDADLGNASSLHSAGQRAKNLIEDARQKVADLINADPAEILFTSGGSESNNTVIHTFAEKTIATSAVEHPSVLEPTKKSAKSHLLLPVDEQGIVSPKNLPPADLYSVMFANNELGTIEPIKQLAAKKPKNSFFHSDLTQAVGKTKLDVKTLGLDYATFSAHKIGGPVGIGALFVKKGSPLTPLILGGHQEHGLRAGTYPTVQIAGFGAAADFITKTHPWKIYKERVSLFRNYLASRILKEIPFSSLNTPLDHSLANILNVSFAAAEGESIQLYLDLKGNIIVSTGSACASGDGKPSHVIMATKNDAEIAHSSIRFSLDLETTKEDIDKIMDLLPDIIKNLQSISTIKPKEQK